VWSRLRPPGTGAVRGVTGGTMKIGELTIKNAELSIKWGLTIKEWVFNYQRIGVSNHERFFSGCQWL